MRISNSAALGSTKRARHAVSILEAGLEAADPARIIPRFVADGAVQVDGRTVQVDGYNIHTVAVGKAADAMSRAVSRILPVRAGVVVVPRDSKPAVRGRRFHLYRSEHPRPGRGSVAAAKAVLKFLSNRRENDLVLFLISGGASSLLALPAGITLSDKMHTTDVLLRCGASIHEINCVRKHISGIKGGRLLDAMSCAGMSLIMSDVEGDDPGTIASGMTHMDPTTYGDALDIIERYDITSKMPSGVAERLLDGAAGYIPDTPKTARIPHQIIANNDTCLEAMQARAARLGYEAAALSYHGDVQEAADSIADAAQDGGCMVFGGEPRVVVSGQGRGGRSQELVLRAARRLESGMLVASMGTDGIDGNSRAAGALHEGVAVDHAFADSCIARNDSHAYFAKYGGLIMTGHTGTNLLDIGVVLARRPSGIDPSATVQAEPNP